MAILLGKKKKKKVSLLRQRTPGTTEGNHGFNNPSQEHRPEKKPISDSQNALPFYLALLSSRALLTLQEIFPDQE